MPSLFCERRGRWNSPYINHFLSPDTIIPDVSNPQFLNRYSYALNNPIRYNDPTGHCPVCIFPIAVADIALVAGTVLFVATLLHPAVHDAMVESITKGINALEVKIQKPLTKDEEEKVKHVGEDSEEFLQKHPDLEEEAQKRANGEETEFDHVGEAEQWVRGLENDIKHLDRVRDLRSKDAQEAIDRAISQGRKWIERINRKLYGDE